MEASGIINPELAEKLSISKGKIDLGSVKVWLLLG